MPFLVQNIDDGAGIIYEGRGALTRDDVIQQARALRPPEQDSKIRYMLIDLCSLEEVALNACDIRDLASENQNSPTATHPRLIAVAAPGDQIFGISRMWQMLVDQLHWTVQIFRTREEAKQWIVERCPGAKFEPC